MGFRDQRGIEYTPDGGVVRTGGQAVVYRAVDPEGRPWAIRRARDTEDNEWFERERDELQRMHAADPGLREHLVEVIDWGVTEEGLLFLVLPWFERNMVHWLEGKGGAPGTVGPPSLERRLLAAEMAARAVVRCHAAHQGPGDVLVHRDVKPSNLLVEDDGEQLRVVLADFGYFKRVTADSTGRHTTVFQPGYSPPEQALQLGLKPAPEWDTYALAATVFTMLTHTRLRAAERAQDIDLLTPIGRQLHDLARRAQGGERLAGGDARQLQAMVRRPLTELVELDRVPHLLDEDHHRLERAFRSGLPTDLPRRDDVARALRDQAMGWMWHFTHPEPWRRGTPSMVLTCCGQLRQRLRWERRGAAEAAAGADPVTVENLPEEITQVVHDLPTGSPRLGVALALCTLAIVVAGAVRIHQQSHAPRDVTVRYPGLFGGTPVALKVQGGAWTALQAGSTSLPAAPVGDLPFDLLAGEGCSLDLCPGSECPLCCSTTSGVLSVPPGMGTVDLGVVVPPPPGVCQVELTLPYQSPDHGAVTLLDGEPPIAEDGHDLLFGPRSAGVHQLSYRVGVRCEACVDASRRHCCPTQVIPVDIDGQWTPFELVVGFPPAPPPCPTVVQDYRMVEIPAGQLQREVAAGAQTIQLAEPFWMGETEVTEALWSEVMGEPVHDGADPRLPRHSVTRDQAIAFCNELSAKERLTPAYVNKEGAWHWDPSAEGYRLPTDAEWEYAARARPGLPFAGTDDPEVLCRYANISRTLGDDGQPLCDDGFGGLAPVKSFLANGRGLFDMTGNLREWVWDSELTYLAGEHDSHDRWTGGTGNVTRGGSYGHAAERLSLATRHPVEVEGQKPAWAFVGFRVSRNSPQGSGPDASALAE